MRGEAALIFLPIFGMVIELVEGDCNLDVNTDLPKKNEPLFLRRIGRNNDSMALLLPTVTRSKGIIKLQSKEEIFVACTGNRNALRATKVPFNRAVCQSSTSLSVNGQDLQSSELECNSRPTADIRITRRRCADGGGVIVELGFEVLNKWFMLVDVCHSIEQSQTFYTRHIIHGALLAGKVTREEGARPGFSRGNSEFYKGFAPDRVYTQRNQETVLSREVGGGEARRLLSTSFLAKGHLAPDADFLLTPHQHLSYFYINTAPQWQSINARNWRKVEEKTRKAAEKIKGDLEVVTGTYGVLQLMSEGGSLRKIYLQDSRLPVPELFWKVVRNTRDSSCIAFISYNNPFASGPLSTVCPDVCAENNWPVLQDDPSKGYIYCCDSSQLNRTLSILPRLNCRSTFRMPSNERDRSDE